MPSRKNSQKTAFRGMGILLALSLLALFANFPRQVSAASVTEGFEGPGPTTGVVVAYNGLPVSTSTGTVYYQNNYSGQYGQSGYGVFINSGSGPLTFDFPPSAVAKSFTFNSGAKNGNSSATVYYVDGTTASMTVLDDCSVGCTRTQSFQGNGTNIDKFSIALDSDIWLFDNLVYDDETTATTTTSTTSSTTSSTSTTTTSSSVPAQEGSGEEGSGQEEGGGQEGSGEEGGPEEEVTAPSTGLAYQVYDNFTGQNGQYNASPPLPPTTPIVDSGTVALIDQAWGGGEIFNSGIYEDAVVKYLGYLSPPEAQTYYICASSDDGFQLILDNEIVIDDWYDRGGGCGQTADVDFSNGMSKYLVGWYYENGGGAGAQLLYYTGQGNWEVIPDSWYSKEHVTPLDENVMWVEIDEGGQSTITAPEGNVFTSVEFASYGTPYGWDGRYLVDSECHASNSAEIVEDILVGEASGTLEANNGVFGDPCAGVTKSLFVTVAYAPGSTTTTTVAAATTVPTATTTPSAPTAPPPSPTSTLPVESSTTSTAPETTVPNSTLPQTTVAPTTVPPTTVPPTTVKPSPTTQASTPTTVPAPTTTSSQPPVSTLPSAPSTVPQAEAPREESTKITEATLPPILAEALPNRPADELTEEDKAQVVAAVAAIISEGVTQEAAVALAATPAVLQSVSTEQAAAVFEQVDAGAISQEVASQIVDAVQDAPEEVRGVFEAVVDLFAGAFDEYTMLGSTIDVGSRRTVVAVTLATTAATNMAAMAAAPSTGGSPAPNAPRTDQNTASRREDEAESEANGEIAGDGTDWVSKLRIFKYENGVRTVDWKAFWKKLSYGFINMGFTLAGSLVVYLTLSGTIQKIAGIATVLAFVGAMYLHMKEPDEE